MERASSAVDTRIMEFSKKGVDSLIKEIINQEAKEKTLKSNTFDLVNTVVGRDKFIKEFDASLNTALDFVSTDRLDGGMRDYFGDGRNHLEKVDLSLANVFEFQISFADRARTYFHQKLNKIFNVFDSKIIELNTQLEQAKARLISPNTSSADKTTAHVDVVPIMDPSQIENPQMDTSEKDSSQMTAPTVIPTQLGRGTSAFSPDPTQSNIQIGIQAGCSVRENGKNASNHNSKQVSADEDGLSTDDAGDDAICPVNGDEEGRSSSDNVDEELTSNNSGDEATSDNDVEVTGTSNGTPGVSMKADPNFINSVENESETFENENVHGIDELFGNKSVRCHCGKHFTRGSTYENHVTRKEKKSAAGQSGGSHNLDNQHCELNGCVSKQGVLGQKRQRKPRPPGPRPVIPPPTNVLNVQQKEDLRSVDGCFQTAGPHSPFIFFCRVCFQEFPYRSARKKHEKHTCRYDGVPDPGGHTCHLCTAIFSTKAAVAAHKRRDHPAWTRKPYATRKTVTMPRDNPPWTTSSFTGTRSEIAVQSNEARSINSTHAATDISVPRMNNPTPIIPTSTKGRRTLQLEKSGGRTRKPYARKTVTWPDNDPPWIPRLIGTRRGTRAQPNKGRVTATDISVPRMNNPTPIIPTSTRCRSTLQLEERSPRVVLTPCQDPVVVVNGLLREEDITVNANEDGLWMDPLAAQTDDNQEGTEINASAAPQRVTRSGHNSGVPVLFPQVQIKTEK